MEIIKGAGFPAGGLVGVADSRIPGACDNCGGARVVVHTTVTSGPSDHDDPPPTGPGRAAIWTEAGWLVGESKTMPCPVCSGNREELVSLLLSRCGVPLGQRTAGLSFLADKPGKEMLHEACRAIIDQLPGITGLFTFRGGTGTGKSTAATILVVAACRSGVRARYTTANELMVEIKDTWGDHEKSESEVLGRLDTWQLLVIDEVERVARHDRERLNSVVDARYRNRAQVATVLVTGDMAVGEYIKSRMNDGLVIPVDGPDLRL